MANATRLAIVGLVIGLLPACLPTEVRAQPGATLMLNWNQCAADGRLTDLSFSCDANTGYDFAVASVTLSGADRTGVRGVGGVIDIAVAGQSLPPWWQTLAGQCRENQLVMLLDPSASTPACPPWYAPGGVARDHLGAVATLAGVDGPNSIQLQIQCYLLADEVTLPAGSEISLFQILLTHAKSTGTTECAGCRTSACLGFGCFNITYSDGSTEYYTGTASNTATWQEGYVTGYDPTLAHLEGGGWEPYHGNLTCSGYVVPAHGRTWGLIKSLYR